jgi:hypothetical protein
MLVCEIKEELKRLKVKGITGKSKPELLAMLDEAKKKIEPAPVRQIKLKKKSEAVAPEPPVRQIKLKKKAAVSAPETFVRQIKLKKKIEPAPVRQIKLKKMPATQAPEPSKMEPVAPVRQIKLKKKPAPVAEPTTEPRKKFRLNAATKEEKKLANEDRKRIIKVITDVSPKIDYEMWWDLGTFNIRIKKNEQSNSSDINKVVTGLFNLKQNFGLWVMVNLITMFYDNFEDDGRTITYKEYYEGIEEDDKKKSIEYVNQHNLKHGIYPEEPEKPKEKPLTKMEIKKQEKMERLKAKPLETFNVSELAHIIISAYVDPTIPKDVYNKISELIKKQNTTKTKISSYTAIPFIKENIPDYVKYIM